MHKSVLLAHGPYSQNDAALVQICFHCVQSVCTYVHFLSCLLGNLFMLLHSDFPFLLLFFKVTALPKDVNQSELVFTTWLQRSQRLRPIFKLLQTSNVLTIKDLVTWNSSQMDHTYISTTRVISVSITFQRPCSLLGKMTVQCCVMIICQSQPLCVI